MDIIPISFEQFCNALAAGQETDRVEDGEVSIVALEYKNASCVLIQVASGGCYQLKAA